MQVNCIIMFPAIYIEKEKKSINDKITNKSTTCESKNMFCL